jgi:hypothetical protein
VSPQPPPPPPYGYPPGPGQPPYGSHGYGGYPPQQYWPPPPPRIDPKELRPSRVWYWLSAVPAVVGCIIAVVLLVEVINRFDTDFDRFTTPARVTVNLDKDDERGIYLHRFGHPRSASASGAVVSCSVRGPNERSIPLRDASSFTLTINNDEFVEQQRFVAPVSGQYVVSCQEPSGVPLALGPHLAFRQFWGPIIGMILAAVLGILLSAVIAIVTAVRRSNHKQRLQREWRESQGPSGPYVPPR